MRKRIDLEKYPIRIAISKERRRLKSSGEIRVYKRCRGYVEMDERDVTESWVAIKVRDFNLFKSLLLHFDNLLEKEISEEINEKKYPVLFMALKQYEEKHEDAWVHDYGIPRIYWDFLKALLFKEWMGFGQTTEMYLEEKGISVYVYELEDDLAYLWENIEEKLQSEYTKLGGVVHSIEALDYGEINIELHFGSFIARKRGTIYLDKSDNAYKIEIRMNGSSSIGGIYIS